MVRLTGEVLLSAESFLNAFSDREINLRGMKIPAVENIALLQDQYDVIDLSDNDIKKLDNFPSMNRLSTLLLHNNSISRVNPSIGTYLKKLTSLLLNNNNISYFYEIEHLSSLKSLELLCLLENPITYKSYYRQYVIYCLPQLKSLDFLKISKQERQEITDFFQKNHAGKQLLVEISKEKEDYYRSLQQKLSAGAAAVTASSSSSSHSGQSHAPPRPAGPPPTAQSGVGKLQLTDEQREEVKEAIQNASTREEIDMIEQQLKNGTFPFKSSSAAVNEKKRENDETADDSGEGRATKKAKIAHSQAAYNDIDVID